MRNALDNSGLFNTKNLLATENNMPTRKNHRLMLLNGGTYEQNDDMWYGFDIKNFDFIFWLGYIDWIYALSDTSRGVLSHFTHEALPSDLRVLA